MSYLQGVIPAAGTPPEHPDVPNYHDRWCPTDHHSKTQHDPQQNCCLPLTSGLHHDILHCTHFIYKYGRNRLKGRNIG